MGGSLGRLTPLLLQGASSSTARPQTHGTHSHAHPFTHTRPPRRPPGHARPHPGATAHAPQGGGRLGHVRPLPRGGIGAADVDVLAAVPLGAEAHELGFLGPALPDAVACGIARGGLLICVRLA